DAAGPAGAARIGAPLGGMLPAEVAALSRATVNRLVLIAPYGLFDAAAPTADAFAVTPDQLPALLCADPAAHAARTASPENASAAEAEEWGIMLARAAQSAARLLWPLGERGLGKRLHRIVAPTLVVWGSADRILPPEYADRFVGGIAGPTQSRRVAGAGHLVDADAPEALARHVEEFLAG